MVPVLGCDNLIEALLPLQFVLFLIVIDLGFVEDKIVVVAALLLHRLRVFPPLRLLLGSRLQCDITVIL
ncbi:hypothetical protein BV898_02674 [Hypsibius exemplaris]|uniref:Uncharacterized protein n=1 Tax=Hypsibius exemplaris TaxID=2072580 RepID=A0A1W0X7Q0_HYPEX|nr:hypothetical protein BV898_02674 [Hypsibius exemplaris]